MSNKSSLKLIILPPTTKTNEFKSLKVVEKPKEYNGENHGVTTTETIIGRPAGEFFKRKPPIFDEDKKHLINFRNPMIRWVFTCYKVVNSAKGKSIFG